MQDWIAALPHDAVIHCKSQMQAQFSSGLHLRACLAEIILEAP
jgi:hypothetical protein